MRNRTLLLLSCLASASAQPDGKCKSDLQCSLNGVCTKGSCICDKPWKGPSCGLLGYKKTTPISGKSLFPLNKSHNTWNGPIVGPLDGTFHLFNPYYGNYTGIKSLFKVEYIMHGTSDKIEGPFSWGVQPNIPGGINPMFLTYNDSQTGKTRYTLWNGGIREAQPPFINWTNVPAPHGGGDCGTNGAPAYHNGTFYCVSQHTTEIVSTPTLGGKWTKLADINVTTSTVNNTPYAKLMPNIEDPYLWIDRRGNFHVINHRYWNETDHCYTSKVSAHTFSPDGKSWHVVEPEVEPYSHTVNYDDGSSFTFATLERPNLHFDSEGQLTHINLAADLTTTDAGCNGVANEGKANSCAHCKFLNHCGTTIIALDV